ncbi:hypothetical protein HWV62_795 [Athelia sp. TMB]|nr:hypothetical protein HWV62_795 [Athelia sp. TMB]
MDHSPDAALLIERFSHYENHQYTLDDVLEVSLLDEKLLRSQFAAHPDHYSEQLSNPYAGLIDVFKLPPTLRISRAREVSSAAELGARHIVPIPMSQRRADGLPSMVDSLEAFRCNWSLFTEGMLSRHDIWGNVIAAGGSVLACLSPLPDAVDSVQDVLSKYRALRRYYHTVAYPSSDIDLFLWGMTPKQAEWMSPVGLHHTSFVWPSMPEEASKSIFHHCGDRKLIQRFEKLTDSRKYELKGDTDIRATRFMQHWSRQVAGSGKSGK